MTENQRIAYEKEIREKIVKENRQKKAEWRESHKDNIRVSNEKYYKKLKEMRILAQASEIIAQRQKEGAELQALADELSAKASEMRGGIKHD